MIGGWLRGGLDEEEEEEEAEEEAEGLKPAGVAVMVMSSVGLVRVPLLEGVAAMIDPGCSSLSSSETAECAWNFFCRSSTEIPFEMRSWLAHSWRSFCWGLIMCCKSLMTPSIGTWLLSRRAQELVSTCDMQDNAALLSWQIMSHRPSFWDKRVSWIRRQQGSKDETEASRIMITGLSRTGAERARGMAVLQASSARLKSCRRRWGSEGGGEELRPNKDSSTSMFTTQVPCKTAEHVQLGLAADAAWAADRAALRRERRSIDGLATSVDAWWRMIRAYACERESRA